MGGYEWYFRGEERVYEWRVYVYKEWEGVCVIIKILGEILEWYM